MTWKNLGYLAFQTKLFGHLDLPVVTHIMQETLYTGTEPRIGW